MAFHLHLISSLPDCVPAASPQLRHGAGPVFAQAQLFLRWGEGDDGRPRAHWVHM